MSKFSSTLFLFTICFVAFSTSYSWDSSTPYAQYYKINGTKATQNDRSAKIMYLLTSKQAVPEGKSKVSIRINSYGQAGSPTVVILDLGLITQSNKNKMSALDQLGALEFKLFFNYKFASICIDARCPAQYLKELYVAENEIIDIQIDTISLEASFYLPSKNLRYPVKLEEQYWENKKIYAFFEVKNFGGQVQFLN